MDMEPQLQVPRPGPPEILRASQKDGVYIQNLTAQILEWILLVKGQRTWLKVKPWAESFGALVYYGLTTLCGSQTLGEEYTGILPVVVGNGNGIGSQGQVKVPSKKILLSTILLQVFSEKLITELRKLLVGARITKLTGILDILVPFIVQAHTTLFWVQGVVGGLGITYYHLAKRLFGVQYILLRKWFGNSETQSLKLLVWMSLVNFGLGIISQGISFWGKEQEHEEENPASPVPTPRGRQTENLEAETCTLCLESRKSPPALTPCGHLFCWDCLINWLRQDQQICPICRESVGPSQIVPLQNYA